METAKETEIGSMFSVKAESVTGVVQAATQN